MTVPTIHLHCRHSNTVYDHEDAMSVCSDALDKLTTNPFWTTTPATRPNTANPRLRRPQTLQSFIMKERREKKKRSLHIENLDPSTSIRDLERAFANFGPICNSTIRRNLSDRTSHGTLVFADKKTKLMATLAHGTRIGDRPIFVTPKRRRCGHGRKIERDQGAGAGVGVGAGTLEHRAAFRNITNAPSGRTCRY